MSERSNLISKLKSDFKARVSYIQAKVGTLVPSQIRALRLKSEMARQSDLAREAELHQSRISMFETPGANPTITTLSTIAAALKVGLVVKFVPFSEMLAWENGFSQDRFNVVKLDNDLAFLNPMSAQLPIPAVTNSSPWPPGLIAFYRPAQPVSPTTSNLLGTRPPIPQIDTWLELDALVGQGGYPLDVSPLPNVSLQGRVLQNSITTRIQ